MAQKEEITRDMLTDLVLDRSTFKRVSVTEDELEKLQYDMAEKYNQVFVGGSSVTVMDTRTKYIDWREYPVTLTEMARAYLRLCYAYHDAKPWQVSPRARGWDQKPPIYAQPVRHRGLAYVDIRSAYWQLARPIGPDVLVHIERRKRFDGRVGWLDPLSVDADRDLRLRVIGATMSHGLSVWRKGKLCDLPVCGSYANPSLCLTLLGTLSAIAAEAVDRFPVHAWLTDAAICDVSAADDIVTWLEDRWHVESRIVSQGMGAVYNVTSYRVGDKVSEDVYNNPRGKRTWKALPLERKTLIPIRTLRKWRREDAELGAYPGMFGDSPRPSHDD